VCVIYDHERGGGAGDRKMEVGMPGADSGSGHDPWSATLEDDFHKARREGAQNHPSPSADDAAAAAAAPPPVACFHQRDDAPEVMRDAAVLQKFVIGESACATRTSTKNFQLVFSRASRAKMLPPQTDAGGEQGQGEEEVLLQMGKLDDDVFSCAYKAPFTCLQAFMICLSRFETKQKY
jgi:hypothetical protein